jgi:hypothetical protein
MPSLKRFWRSWPKLKNGRISNRFAFVYTMVLVMTALWLLRRGWRKNKVHCCESSSAALEPFRVRPHSFSLQLVHSTSLDREPQVASSRWTREVALRAPNFPPRCFLEISPWLRWHIRQASTSAAKYSHSRTRLPIVLAMCQTNRMFYRR